jgi:hypothetical protein
MFLTQWSALLAIVSKQYLVYGTSGEYLFSLMPYDVPATRGGSLETMPNV